MTISSQTDVIIIGTGADGLSAARELTKLALLTTKYFLPERLRWIVFGEVAMAHIYPALVQHRRSLKQCSFLPANASGKPRITRELNAFITQSDPAKTQLVFL